MTLTEPGFSLTPLGAITVWGRVSRIIEGKTVALPVKAGSPTASLEPLVGRTPAVLAAAAAAEEAD